MEIPVLQEIDLKDHLSRRQLELYVERNLETEELLAADRHLVECALCREALLSLLSPESLFGSLGSKFLNSAEGEVQTSLPPDTDGPSASCCSAPLYAGKKRT